MLSNTLSRSSMAQLAKPVLEGDLLIINTDGACRGNPGHSATGYVVGGLSFGRYIGFTTNNDAEYQAIIMALEKARELLGDKKAQQTRLEVRMDSELACKQLNGLYKVKNPKIKEHFATLQGLIPYFAEVRFKHVYREFNKDADAAGNKALDDAGY